MCLVKLWAEQLHVSLLDAVFLREGKPRADEGAWLQSRRALLKRQRVGDVMLHRVDRGRVGGLGDRVQLADEPVEVKTFFFLRSFLTALAGLLAEPKQIRGGVAEVAMLAVDQL